VNDEWRYELSPRAVRDLRQLDPPTRRRIFEALERLVEVPAGGDQRKLRGSNDEWRLRVGDWRVRFRKVAETRTIVVVRILHRSAAYRD
jgi:mRNA interferase RelE/StbE